MKCLTAISRDLNNVVVRSRMTFMKQQRETLSFVGRVRSLLSAGPAAPRQVEPPLADKPVVAANHIRRSKAGFGKRARNQRNG